VTHEEVAQIRNLPFVEGVASSSAMPGLMIGIPALLVFGRHPDEPLLKVYERELEGRLLKDKSEIMLGAVAAKQLQKKVGDKFWFLGETFTVVGIYRTRVSWENGAAVSHIDVIRRRLHPNHSGMVAFIYLREPGRWREAAEELERRMPRMRVVRTENVVIFFQEQLVYIDYFVWIISVAALVMGAICVLIVMLMSVSERVREIGTLRAFGWTRRKVIGLILAEGAVVSVLGGAAGVILGVVGAEILLQLIPQGYFDSHYSWETFAKGLGVAIGVGLTGAMYPAFVASRLAPAEALRYE
jgi:putative ABC transport system permease protein